MKNELVTLCISFTAIFISFLTIRDQRKIKALVDEQRALVVQLLSNNEESKSVVDVNSQEDNTIHHELDIISSDDRILLNEIIKKAYPEQGEAFFQGQALIFIRMSVVLSNSADTFQLMDWIKVNVIDGDFSEAIRAAGDNKAVNDAIHPYSCTLFPKPSLKSMEKAKKERQPSLLIDVCDSRDAYYVASEVCHGWHSDAMFLIKGYAKKIVAATCIS